MEYLNIQNLIQKGSFKMSRERKINVKVDTSNLPKKGNFIDWKKSIGYKVKFIYEDLSGEIGIVDRLDNGRLLLKYKDRIIELVKNKGEI